ncbi:hypothetical protein FA15DRAFT_673034 [Coprinopsis marcescibilis]|uniref:Uncharacterized protein n=1 Tax=Coprinopsis marcescibilis TaxID=230819 RepID=A0A5C3KLV0_COPMA|nr:hypothetical protein FA15DRAFT_673034 [Coprinopsis marcescibilis]
MSTLFPVPALIGGVTRPEDFVPSIVFGILYVGLIILAILRICQRRSRTFAIFGATFFVFERTLFFILRATGAKLFWDSPYLTLYQQITLSLGYYGIANDILMMHRCLLVNPTHGSETYGQSPAARTKECELTPPQFGEADRPRERFWARRINDFVNFVLCVGIVFDIVAYWSYNTVLRDESFTSRFYPSYLNGVDESRRRNFDFRQASAGVGLFGLVLVLASLVWSFRTQHRTSKRGTWIVGVTALLTCIVPIYRLSVMGTTNGAGESPYSILAPLNSPGSKAAFYILHITPEWITSAILLGLSIKKTFGTAAWGDTRYRDERPEETVRRELQTAQREVQRQIRTADPNTTNPPPQIQQR